jgi:cytochrome P450
MRNGADVPNERPIEALSRFIRGGGRSEPWVVYRRLQAEEPVAYDPSLDTWFVSRWDDVTEGLADEGRFQPFVGELGSSAIYGRTVLHMEGQEHRRKVALIARRLRSPTELRGSLAQRVEAVVEELFEHVEPGRSLDLRDLVTVPLPLTVMAELMAMHEAPRFLEWYHRIVAASVSNVTGDPVIHERGIDAREQLFAWLDGQIASKRDLPTDDLLTDLATGVLDETRLSDAEIKALAAFLLAAGIETTERSLTSLTRQLVDDPLAFERLRAEPELVGSAVAEILRFKPPVHGATRRVRRTHDLRGRTLEEGQKVIFLLAAANRDPQVFEAPDEYQVDRFLGREHHQYARKGPTRSFGAGPHLCAGSLLARLELETYLRRLVRFRRIEGADGYPTEEFGFMLRSAPSVNVVLQS